MFPGVPRFNFHIIAMNVVAITIAFGCSTLVSATDMFEERILAKPWYSQEIHPLFPVTPVTIICFFVATIYIVSSIWGAFSDSGISPTAEASHILVSKGSDPEGVLREMKKNIGNNDKVKFAALAKQHSECPSGAGAGGSLGSFRKYAMAPPFDKAVFDPAETDEGIVGKVLGPIQTQFGWHLIMVHKRQT